MGFHDVCFADKLEIERSNDIVSQKNQDSNLVPLSPKDFSLPFEPWSYSCKMGVIIFTLQLQWIANEIICKKTWKAGFNYWDHSFVDNLCSLKYLIYKWEKSKSQVIWMLMFFAFRMHSMWQWNDPGVWRD